MDPQRQWPFNYAFCISGGKPGWPEEGGIHTVALLIGSMGDACLLTCCEWLHLCFLAKRSPHHNAFARRLSYCLAQTVLDFNPAFLLYSAEVFTFTVPPPPPPKPPPYPAT